MLSVCSQCVVCVGGGSKKYYGGKVSIAYPATSFSIEILRAYDIDVRNDDPTIHPTHFCSLCKSALSRHVCSTSSATFPENEGVCGPLRSKTF